MIPVLDKGRLAIVTNVKVWDAMDAVAAVDEKRCLADGETRVLPRRRWRRSSAE